MSEQQSVEIDLDKLRARMQIDKITEDDIDLLFALLTVERKRGDTAEFKAMILEAQLGGWEAACAAQVLAARAYLDALSGTGHTDGQLRARGQLEHAIDSNAGAILLARLRPADELADAVEQEHEMRRAAETDPARLMDLAAASYRLSAALANYRKAQKARGQ